jgi:osmotically-inducible protein OsmY
MKKHLLIVSSLCLLLTACANDNGKMDADNTGRNVRDRNGQSITSGNQSESEADRTITQRIRQAIVDDNSLSTNAKNIKIITINGVVTLRGPVNNDREKNEIGRKVQSVSGVKNVDNQLEIIRNDEAGGR